VATQGKAWLGKVRRDYERKGVDWEDKARLVKARRGEARQGVARQGKVRLGQPR
jgi:hypothetical protein